ncbi:MAG: site-specific integrase [Spirosomataceae bacterium]
MKEIRFKLITEKIDGEGKMPVYLYFNYHSYQFRFFTKEKVKPKDWDAAKMRFKRSHAGFQQANEYLDILEEKLRKAYRDYMNQGIIPTPSLLKSELLPEPVVDPNAQPAKSMAIVPLFEEFIQSQLAKGIKPGTKKSYTTNLSRLKRYVATGKSLSADGYTNSIHQQVVRTLIDLYNLQPNSVMDFCKQMKVFFNYCRTDKHITLHPYHADIKSGFVQTDRIYLTENDLEKLHHAELTDSMVRVRDAFLFACYTGLRYSDLSRIKADHVIERGTYKLLSFIPEKTSSALQKKVKRVEIPLIGRAAEIIEKYSGIAGQLIPVITNQKMNEYLKVIGMWAGLTDLIEVVTYEKGKPTLKLVPKYEKISCHIARHTYATLSLTRGVPVEVLQKALGHADIKTTMVYAKVIDEYKDRVILEAWNK